MIASDLTDVEKGRVTPPDMLPVVSALETDLLSPAEQNDTDLDLIGLEDPDPGQSKVFKAIPPNKRTCYYAWESGAELCHVVVIGLLTFVAIGLLIGLDWAIQTRQTDYQRATLVIGLLDLSMIGWYALSSYGRDRIQSFGRCMFDFVPWRVIFIVAWIVFSSVWTGFYMIP